MSRSPRRGGGPRSSSPSTTDSSILLVAVAVVSFFAGTVFTAHMNLGCIVDGVAGSHHHMNAKVEELAQKRLLELQAAALPDRKKCEESSAASGPGPGGILQFPDTTKKYAVGMARTPKTEFFELIDVGVPMDIPKNDNEDSDVLILYSRDRALPIVAAADGAGGDSSSSIPSLGTKDAVANCDYLNVVLTDHSKGRNQCMAIVPQYESYHVQKWMRVGKKGIDSTKQLEMVSRGMQSNGRNQFEPPTKKNRKANWDMLRKYYDAFDGAIEDLKPLVKKVATRTKTVTVMVSNFGQSELLVNFVCAARSRRLDISSILVFATDLETKELAESLGLTAFYDKRNFDSIPSEAAKRYGDAKFTAMMMAKVMCVQMVSSLGYNILFQDVDIVWYKNPIPFFEEKDSPLQNFDMLFQDDGGHSVRYAPYSANSGFYYVRHTARTEHFFSALLNAGDLIFKTDSHQQALIALMSEHVSLYGLKIKVFARETDEFPGGYHFHQKSGQYMRDFFAGKVDPYIFHMSWTLNKDNKLLFLQQMGEWYVKDECVHKKVGELPSADATSKTPFADECCLAEPAVKCHYRDKPSKVPCRESPPIDKGKPSFWK